MIPVDATALACFGLTAVVLAPLFEETIFRGVLLPVAPAWALYGGAAAMLVAVSVALGRETGRQASGR